MKRLISVFAAMAVVTMFLFSAAYAGTGDVTVTYWGQSAFKLETNGKTILIDPWITNNPLAAQAGVTVDSIPSADYIFISHDHFDHVGDTYDSSGNPIKAGDTIALAKKTGAIVVAEYETAQRLMAEGLPPQNVLFGGYGKPLGGPVDLPLGTDIMTVISTPAVHSSDSGVSVGWILKFPGGVTVYHAGDTAIFSDMLLYGSLYPIELALLPVGGYGTMDGFQAAKSLMLLTPRKAIPMHYGTFPMLAPDPSQFVSLARIFAPKVGVTVLQPASSLTIHPR
jgi:L-ascorbate metabolism protein UlaG (beta-lactamase superfamily)